MKHYLTELTQRHRRLNRLIDASKSAGRHFEMQAYKRLRLRIKDQITACRATLRNHADHMAVANGA